MHVPDALTVCLLFENSFPCVGTARVVREMNPTGELRIEFMPSKANAAFLARELPLPSPSEPRIATHENHAATVLYPASQRAASTLQHGLASRGFDVQRLDTYDTVAVSSVSEEGLQQALACDVIAIASPSALKAWISIAGEAVAKRGVIACIGQTSGDAALSLGFARERVFWPDNPGMDGFVVSVLEALGQCAAV
jgi:uroporphyrinogen-III synthase